MPAKRFLRTFAGSVITIAQTFNSSEGIATLHLHTPCITTLEIKGCSLQCSDLDKTSRLSNLQHLTYDATGGNSYDCYRLKNFDPNQHHLFAARGFKSPLKGLSNLVSLHIEEDIRYGHKSPREPSKWVSELSLLATVAVQQVVLKLHQVLRDSDWMSDFDDSVSYVSGDECENCKSLSGDIQALVMDSSNSDSDHDSSDID